MLEQTIDVNLRFHENYYKPIFTKEEVIDKKYDPEGVYESTALINVIRSEAFNNI